MYEVAQSLLEAGRFVPDNFLQVESFLREQTKKDDSTMWQDVFSLTHDGRVFPKHSLLSSLILVPFIAVFGIWGVSVLNVLVQTGTVVSIHRVASLLQPGIPWTTSFLSVLIGTQIMHYSGGVAYDSLGGFLVIAATAIVGSRPLVAGGLVGLAVFCRPVNVLYAAVPFLFAERRFFMRLVIGMSVPLVSFLIMNFFLWGSPFTTAYQRLPMYQSGEPVITLVGVGFELRTLASDWGDKLFGSQRGLLLFNPILFCLPFLRWGELMDARRIGIILVCLSQSALVFAYDGWSASWGGNRYLCPAVWLLAAIGVGVIYNRFVSKRRSISPP